jgi:hypothetical protein
MCCLCARRVGQSTSLQLRFSRRRLRLLRDHFRAVAARAMSHMCWLRAICRLGTTSASGDTSATKHFRFATCGHRAASLLFTPLPSLCIFRIPTLGRLCSCDQQACSRRCAVPALLTVRLSCSTLPNGQECQKITKPDMMVCMQIRDTDTNAKLEMSRGIYVPPTVFSCIFSKDSEEPEDRR